jgi:hypothetical protein
MQNNKSPVGAQSSKATRKEIAMEEGKQKRHELEALRKALLKRWEISVAADPYRAILQRRNYYTLKRRVRLEDATDASLNCPYWEPVSEGRTLLLYAIDERKVLEWFVRLLNSGDLNRLPPSETLAFREDYQAFQARVIPALTKGAGYNRRALPPVEELVTVQQKVRERVDAFFRAGSFTFTEFTPTVLIERHPDDSRRLVRQEFVSSTDWKGMLHLFAALLSRVALSFERCPRCENTFLGKRTDARYCSRECQSLHYAQKKRGDRPPGKRGRPRKIPGPQTQRTSPNEMAKKGAKHGTKVL